MCKHVAAVLYGVGARLDDQPELLFLLRGVNHEDLISSEVGALEAATGSKKSRRRIAEDDLSAIFGIDVSDEGEKKKQEKKARRKPPGRKARATASPEKRTSVVETVTSKDVLALRRKLGMTQHQLAELLGVSANTVGLWERKEGPLKMQARTAVAWSRVAKLSKRAARRLLNEDR